MNEVLVGEVIKPHGIRGELKIFPLTDNPSRFKKLAKVTLEQKGVIRTFNILKVQVHQDEVYLTLEGIETREEAEKLRGFAVKIDRADVPPLEKGWYYFELEGMQVFDGEVCLGVLTQVLQTGANDVYLVKGECGEICVPALKTVVKKVDVPGRRMDVTLPPGLLEDKPQ
ncbi:ribosome maturation factor RimM [Desulfitobacterium sp.]|uniref:ribosome maturation factor RimM n=1 Tax=Desulfitobacterium sp. TaxID=49981 RepID=UPI002B21341D|nr:ribosome maturation factor RimM [Desulfitobacterium sp.]MEA4900178.1 ribosome maturation factor RimM [Desulfitobacterium sp.]